MSSLTGIIRLPRELRDEIYAYVFDDREVPPDNPSAAGYRISEGTLRFQDSLSQPQLKKLSLARTNRQLREEVIDYLSSLQKSRGERAAELDIIFEDYVSWPTWIYFPPEATREAPFDLSVRICVFSVYTFTRYDSVANHDGWNLGDMSAPFLDLLLLLKRLVRYGPSFRRPSHLTDSDVSQTSGLTGNAGLFRMRTLSVSVTFDNGTSNRGNASNIIKCLKRFARCGLARRIIDRLQLHMKFYSYDGEARELSFSWVVRQEADEEYMLSCVRRGFCHNTSETLASGPLYNGEAVKIQIEDWCCG